MKVIAFLVTLIALRSIECKSQTLQDAQGIQGWIQDIRRDLHRIPELGFEEEETSKYIRRKLDELGVVYDYPVAKTGVVGRIGRGKPLVAVRTDMDALPISEEVDVPFKSQTPRLMHACGHDGHMAMLLGAAKLLKQKESTLKGTAVLLFQPAEEGLAGGKAVMDSKALDGVSAIHGLHVWPTLPTGTFASKAGPIMAGSTSFWVFVHGKGGHAAMPHLTIDPVVAAAALVQALQMLVSRETDPVDSAVISVTQFNTGEGATNVISDSVKLGGTLRALNEDKFTHLVNQIEKVVASVVEAHACTAEVSWRTPHYLPTVNDAATTLDVEKLAKKLVGDDRWTTLEALSMGGEDFSFLAKEIPAAFTWLGIRNESAGSVHGLHTPRFQLDESVLHLGAALHTDFVLFHLSNELSRDSEL